MDWLVPNGCAVAVNLAAGTGLLSRALARTVPQVIAVEPDPRMAAILAQRSPGTRVVQGRGEAVPLPDASADGMFISSAWHWLDPDRAVPEIARVLRDGGRFGVIWTGRDRQVSWVRELGRPAPADGGDGRRGPQRRGPRREVVLPPGAPFGPPDTVSFTFIRPMTVGAILGMLATYSGVITASPAERAAALEHAQAVLARHFPDASQIDVPMRAWCWRADRTVRGSSLTRMRDT